MATRTISTRLVIDGEAEFKKAITSINAELRKMGSELKLAESKFAEQANTTEALEAKLKALQNVYEIQKKKTQELTKAHENAQKAQETYAGKVDNLKAKLDAVRKEMDELKQSSDGTADRMTELAAEQKKLNGELDTAQSKYDIATRSVNNWEAQINRSKATETELNRQIRDTSEYLDEAKRSADGCATSIDEFGKKTKEAGEGGADAMQVLSEAIVAGGLAKAIKEVADAMADCVKASMEFETAVTGVYKTVEGTPEQLQKIADGIKQMSMEIPASASEIAGVAEAAGQLGIATNDILSFTETMVNLGAATNMTAEEAATALAQFANITGMTADNYGRLGSTIVALGNNFATTESQITEMSTRIASAGRLAGLSAPQILALSAAMSSVGIQAEAGGTAMTQTLNAISTFVAKGGADLEKIAQVAGMTAQEFAAAWNGDPITALTAFIDGVAQLGESGGNAISVLDELGMSGVRQSNMIRSLSLASDMFSESIAVANQAWAENTALTEEAEKRYATTESKVKMLKNSFDGLKIAVGDELKPALDKIATAGTKAFAWATDFVKENPGVVKALTGIAAAAATVTTVFIGWQAISKLLPVLTSMISAFNAALAANPAGLIAVGVSALVAAIAALALTVEDTTDIYQDFIREVEESRTAYQETVAAMEEEHSTAQELAAQIAVLAEKENKTAVEKQQLIELTNQLNAIVPDLGLAYDSVTDSLNMTVEAMMELIKAQQEHDELVEKAKRAIEVQKQIAEITERLAAAESELTAAKEAATNADDKRSRFDRRREREENARTTRIYMAQRAYDDLTEQLKLLEAEYDELTGTANTANDAMTNTDAATTAANLHTVGEALGSLSEQYASAQAAAYDSLSSQIGMFEEVGAVASRSIDDVTKAFDSQIEYFTAYADNLAKAMEMGLDEGLIKQLSDGSEESAAILQGIVEAGEEKIADLNEKFKAVEESKKTLADTMTEAELNFKQQCDQIVLDAEAMVAGLDLSAAASEAGGKTGQAYITALMDALSGYISASLPDVKYPSRGTVATPRDGSKGSANTYNTTVNVTSPKQLKPSEIAREQTKALRWVTQNAR